MEQQIADLKQLNLTLHTGANNSQAQIMVNESRRSGSLAFIDEAFEIKKVKKFADSYGIAFEAKINNNWTAATLKMVTANPETLITLVAGALTLSATIYHETADFAFYFIRDLNVPTV